MYHGKTLEEDGKDNRKVICEKQKVALLEQQMKCMASIVVSK